VMKILACRSKGHDHSRLDDTSLNTSYGNCANTTNLVYILERETQSFISWTSRWVNGVNSFEESLAGSLGLGFLLPTLVPRAVVGNVDHVVTVESRDGDKGNSLGVVANLLNEIGCLLDDFLVTGLGPFGGVHLVDSNDDLPNTQSVGK